MAFEFLLPFLVIDSEKFGDAFVIDIELVKIDPVKRGQPANGRFDRGVNAFAAIDHPFQHAHIIAETGPKKFTVLAFAEPVDVKDERRIGQAAADVDPMLEIMANVVPAKREHRHGIATDLPDSAGGCCGCF